jgi:glycosyltransferase involved in cell wall biosynthesis
MSEDFLDGCCQADNMSNQLINPFVSVIMPVHNGMDTLERAIGSVVAQTYKNWELLVVNDASTDGTGGLLQTWVSKDIRVQPFFLKENVGPGAARNVALRHATGEFIAYLDSDDEYYADYLEQIALRQEKGDVLIFGNDYVIDDPVVGGNNTFKGPLKPWDPTLICRDMFAQNMATPLGIAHRRRLLAKVNGFNEMLWSDEDWDFIKRLARSGADFAYIPHKSGRYHVRADSLSRAPKLTRRQRAFVLSNYEAGKPIFHRQIKMPSMRPVRKVAFVSPHCLIDFTNGAATATLDGLQLLQNQSFECQVLCSSQSDAWEEVVLEDALHEQQTPFEIREVRVGTRMSRMILTRQGKVPIAIFKKTSSNRKWEDRDEIKLFLATCEHLLAQNRPDVIWTYGGDGVSRAIHRLVKKLDIPIVFFLHNFAYLSPEPFRMMDYTLVSSQYARRFYWDRLGLACQELSLVLDPDRVRVDQWNPQYVTFVNPVPRKGIHVFTRIAEVISQRRPDIPLLMVEGVGRRGFLSKLGVDLSGIKNLKIMANTPDPRDFYSITKLLLMPSLMENVGFCAIEAMHNGIPVLASNRGALPETIGPDGYMLDIPQVYTPKTCFIPTAEEVEPWVDMIVRLWDDKALYEKSSQAAKLRARRWLPDQLAPIYSEFFKNITHQPGPPLVPKEMSPI